MQSSLLYSIIIKYHTILLECNIHNWLIRLTTTIKCWEFTIQNVIVHICTHVHATNILLLYITHMYMYTCDKYTTTVHYTHVHVTNILLPYITHMYMCTCDKYTTTVHYTHVHVKNILLLYITHMYMWQIYYYCTLHT